MLAQSLQHETDIGIVALWIRLAVPCENSPHMGHTGLTTGWGAPQRRPIVGYVHGLAQASCITQEERI